MDERVVTEAQEQPSRGTAGLRAFGRALPRVVIMALTVLVVLLAVQKRQLRVEAADLRMRVDLPYAGLVLPEFEAVTLNGDSVTIGAPAPGTAQVVFVFDTRCGNCLVTLPAWKRASDRVAAAANHTEVYGISLDAPAETREYVTKHELNFPVVRFPSERYRALWKVRGVPMTLVVNDQGAIRYFFLGSIFGDAVPSVVDSITRAAHG